MKFPFSAVLLLFSVVFSSCIPQRRVVLFQKEATSPADLPYLNQDYEFIIAPFDLLALRITGLANDEGQNVAAPFNTPIVAAGAAGAAGGGYASGILVDKEGNIELLYAGKVRVAGLTLNQAADTVRASLSRFIVDTGNNVTVNMKILNYSITMMGEVGSEGILRAENEFMTITEALAKSGGVTEFGNLKTVRIIRTDRLTKQTTTYRLDLTKETAVSPILSRLQPNDIVIVDPIRRKQFATAGQIIGVATTFVSVPLLILSIYQTFRQTR